MNSRISLLPLALLALGIVSPVHAKICDYRPSKLVGKETTAAIGTSGALLTASGGVAKAAGIYTFVNHSTGMTMLGSTLPGVSGANTMGFLAGTSGALGTAGAIVTAPATIAAGVVLVVATGGFEGVCYFRDGRITDYDEVLEILEELSAASDPRTFKLIDGPGGSHSILIPIEPSVYRTFDVADLFIDDGILKVDDWGMNTSLGSIEILKNR